MRTMAYIFHLGCFQCVMCGQPLQVSSSSSSPSEASASASPSSSTTTSSLSSPFSSPWWDTDHYDRVDPTLALTGFDGFHSARVSRHTMQEYNMTYNVVGTNTQQCNTQQPHKHLHYIQFLNQITKYLLPNTEKTKWQIWIENTNFRIKSTPYGHKPSQTPYQILEFEAQHWIKEKARQKVK